MRIRNILHLKVITMMMVAGTGYGSVTGTINDTTVSLPSVKQQVHIITSKSHKNSPAVSDSIFDKEKKNKSNMFKTDLSKNKSPQNKAGEPSSPPTTTGPSKQITTAFPKIKKHKGDKTKDPKLIKSMPPYQVLSITDAAVPSSKPFSTMSAKLNKRPLDKSFKKMENDSKTKSTPTSLSSSPPTTTGPSKQITTAFPKMKKHKGDKTKDPKLIKSMPPYHDGMDQVPSITDAAVPSSKPFSTMSAKLNKRPLDKSFKKMENDSKTKSTPTSLSSSPPTATGPSKQITTAFPKMKKHKGDKTKDPKLIKSMPPYHDGMDQVPSITDAVVPSSKPFSTMSAKFNERPLDKSFKKMENETDVATQSKNTAPSPWNSLSKKMKSKVSSSAKIHHDHTVLPLSRHDSKTKSTPTSLSSSSSLPTTTGHSKQITTAFPKLKKHKGDKEKDLKLIKSMPPYHDGMDQVPSITDAAVPSSKPFSTMSAKFNKRPLDKSFKKMENETDVAPQSKNTAPSPWNSLSKKMKSKVSSSAKIHHDHTVLPLSRHNSKTKSTPTSLSSSSSSLPTTTGHSKQITTAFPKLKKHKGDKEKDLKLIKSMCKSHASDCWIGHLGKRKSKHLSKGEKSDASRSPTAVDSSKKPSLIDCMTSSSPSSTVPPAIRTIFPTSEPTVAQTPSSTKYMSDAPTASNSLKSNFPSALSTGEPTSIPSFQSTITPTTEPTASPTSFPTAESTTSSPSFVSATSIPTAEPSVSTTSSAIPSATSSAIPTIMPSSIPTNQPSAALTLPPSDSSPTSVPTNPLMTTTPSLSTFVPTTFPSLLGSRGDMIETTESTVDIPNSPLDQV